MKIVPLHASYASDAASLHVAGQPGTFLTSLGLDVLTSIYHALPDSAVGFGFAALAEGTGGKPIQGFVSATYSLGKLIFELSTVRLRYFAPPLLRRLVRHPQLLLYSLQTLLYPLRSHAHENGEARIPAEERAELLSVMVDSRHRGQGLGTELVQRLCQECILRRITTLDVTVDAQNVDAERFYERQGFLHQYDFDLYRRTMRSYRLRLSL